MPHFYLRDEYCSIVTQKCKKNKQGRLRGFKEECDGDPQCKAPFTCMIRESSDNSNGLKGWCDTKGKAKQEGCSDSKGSCEIGRHDQCRYVNIGRF